MEPRDSEAQLRLQKLEDMVTSLMRTTKESSESLRDKMSPQVATTDQRFDDLLPQTSNLSPDARSNMNGSDGNYVSATHWTAILENVGFSRGRKASINS